MVLVVALAGAACGARTAPYLGEGAVGAGTAASGPGGTSAAASGPGADAAAGGNGPVVSAGATASGSSAAQAPAIAAAGSTVGGQAGVGAATSLGPSTFPLDPAGQAALCRGGAGNQASDVGVTPTSISFGNVSGLTGLLTNTDNQGPEAVQALFSAVNGAGGVCGRQLKLVVEDDGQDSGKNSADVADLIPRVLAFVGSTSDADNGGVPEMAAAKVPDLGAAINVARGQSSVYFSATGSSVGLKDGRPYLWDSLPRGLKAAGTFPKRIAVLAFSIPISADAGKDFNNLFVQSGSTTCFVDESISPATTSLDSDVVQMKSKGCDGVYTTLDVTGNAKLLQAMARQGYNPPFKGTTLDGYTPAQVSLAGEGAAQGFEVSLPFVAFNDGNPVLNRYISQLKVYEPGKQPSAFGFMAWASAQLAIYALAKAGRNPTRATMTQALQAIDRWDTGGATTPTVPRDRLPAGPCLLETQVKGNDFARKWPSTGFFCAGTLVPVG